MDINLEQSKLLHLLRQYSKKNFLCYVLLALLIFNLIISLYWITQERTILYITSKNRYFINNILEYNKYNTDSIVKLALGNGFHSGSLYIYYQSGNIEEVIIEDIPNLNKLEYYIRENGFSLDILAFALGGTSLFCLFFVIVYKVNIYIRKSNIPYN